MSGDRGKACGAHYRADPVEWPRITEQLQRAEAERAMATPSSPAPAVTLTRSERLAIGARLREIGHRSPGDAKAWAWRLHERHQRGERLTQAQVDTYRQALGSALHPQEDAP